MFDVLFHRAARQRAVEKNEDKKQGGRGGHHKGQIVKAFVGDVGSEHQPKQAHGPIAPKYPNVRCSPAATPISETGACR